jgi:nitric oxide reductase NorD protein
MSRWLDWLEPEEAFGHRWHRLVGYATSWPRHPQAAVALDPLKGALSVFFRGLGGDPAIAVAATMPVTSRHRLAWRLRLGLGEERIAQAHRDQTSLYLPVMLDVFPDMALNRNLYFWLAAFFVQAHPQPPETEADPLRRDLLFLRGVRLATDAALVGNPGLAGMHDALCAALRSLRPARRLPGAEAAVEACVQTLLGSKTTDAEMWPVVCGGTLSGMVAPRQYRTFLPVPLWGEAIDTGLASATVAEPVSLPPAGDVTPTDDERVRRARRRDADQAERKDSLIFNRFEKILTLIESLNINRAVDDDDAEGARKALQDAEEIGLSTHSRRPSTRLRFDIGLPPPAVETERLEAELTYPEWDASLGAYRPNHCRVFAGPAALLGESWEPDAATRRRIRHVRRQFEALRPRHQILRGQLDGSELDLEAVVRARTDRVASGNGSDRVHLAQRRQARDLSVVLLVDVSLSTDSWINNRRVLDVEKETLLVLAHGLDACGDDHAILTFTSRTRRHVTIETVKDFDENLDATVVQRISALRPGFYTRMGTAVRHAAAALQARQNRHRMLLLLTDGKPNDVDHYEGRYGIADTRRAVQDARRSGIAVFCVAIDRKEQAHLPLLFGRGGYAIVGDPARLSAALPTLYRHLVVA